MAKKSAHGEAFLTYFHAKRGVLMSCHEDGVTLYRTPFSNGWKLFARKKADWTIEDWKAAKRRSAEQQPWWAREIRTLPSRATLQRWLEDSMCEATCGADVEHDGYGPGGSPSWLLALHLI
ncbi:hypothetical protein WV31_10835 [Magnetospirillum sp. ME-1]|uniref:hypothetical protein n=1 Tax=Magnetospirillum sp. ME-1 TaxID=1639348 RepID=UPI000A17A19A|nr:hypothetical protein [Magnetospirillum sp. ME-1]ARJ66123.1 hypothetical protein WV31_10835 [Magnetospirillum sp. ME-1]